MRYSVIVLSFIYIYLIGEVECTGVYTSLEHRRNPTPEEKKSCVPTCQLFPSLCKNNGKCKEKKGPDCKWYCECPDNCKGYFCEKVIPKGSKPANTSGVEVKVVIVKEKKIDVSSFDKSKLAMALQNIYSKKKSTNEKPSEGPQIRDRIGKTLTVKETITGTINCPPEFVNGKSPDTVVSEKSAGNDSTRIVSSSDNTSTTATASSSMINESTGGQTFEQTTAMLGSTNSQNYSADAKPVTESSTASAANNTNEPPVAAFKVEKVKVKTVSKKYDTTVNASVIFPSTTTHSSAMNNTNTSSETATSGTTTEIYKSSISTQSITKSDLKAFASHDRSTVATAENTMSETTSNEQVTPTVPQTTVSSASSSYNVSDQTTTTRRAPSTISKNTITSESQKSTSTGVWTTSTDQTTTGNTEMSSTSSPPTTGNIEMASTQTLPTTGNTEMASTQTLPTTGNTEMTSAQTLPTTGNTEMSSTQTLPTTGNTEMASTQTIPTTGNTELTSTQTIPTTGNTEMSSTQTLPTTGSTEMTSTQSLPTTGNAGILPSVSEMNTSLATTSTTDRASETSTTTDAISTQVPRATLQENKSKEAIKRESKDAINTTLKELLIVGTNSIPKFEKKLEAVETMTVVSTTQTLTHSTPVSKKATTQPVATTTDGKSLTPSETTTTAEQTASVSKLKDNLIVKHRQETTTTTARTIAISTSKGISTHSSAEGTTTTTVPKAHTVSGMPSSTKGPSDVILPEKHPSDTQQKHKDNNFSAEQLQSNQLIDNLKGSKLDGPNSYINNVYDVLSSAIRETAESKNNLLVGTMVSSS